MICRLVFILMLALAPNLSADSLVYDGTEGIGKGKHIVFIAGDHEYRSEESLPMLARIMASIMASNARSCSTSRMTERSLLASHQVFPGLKRWSQLTWQ